MFKDVMGADARCCWHSLHHYTRHPGDVFIRGQK